MTSLTKNPKLPNQNIFFESRLETPDAFEHLNSSLAQLAEELWHW